ncbi:MAG: hypothetical protein ACPGRZ_16985 [Alphaproteobacteria bacterium]
MSLWSDLLLEAQRHAHGEALDALQRLQVAALTGQVSGMTGTLLDCAERIGQAEEKVSSGAEIARMSELLTLAQFGAGSIGSAVAAIYNAPESAPGLEALFVSKFLTELVLQRRTYPALFPADLLRKHGIGRQDLGEQSGRPVLADIVERARETAARVPEPGAVSWDGDLNGLLLYERKLLIKRLDRLTANPCVGQPIDLNIWDRLATAISLRLRRRPSA